MLPYPPLKIINKFMPKDKKLIAIDITLQKAQGHGVAYYRLDKNFKDFLDKCIERYGIIGFEYDGSWNFGVILDKENVSSQSK